MKKLFLVLMVAFVGVLMTACGGEDVEKAKTAKELVRNAYHTEVEDNYLAVARFYDGMVEGRGLYGYGEGDSPYTLLSDSSWQVDDILKVAVKTLKSSEVKENEGLEYVYILTSRRETVEKTDKYGEKTKYYVYGDIHIAKFDIEELKKVVDPKEAYIGFEQGVFMTDNKVEPDKETANKALSRFVGLGEMVSEDYLTDLEIADILENSLNNGVKIQLGTGMSEKEEDSIVSKLLPDSVLYNVLLEINETNSRKYPSINNTAIHGKLAEGGSVGLADIHRIKEGWEDLGFYEEEIKTTEEIIERLRENKNQSLPY